MNKTMGLRITALTTLLAGVAARAAELVPAEAVDAAVKAPSLGDRGLIALSAAAAISVACLAAGFAVARVGAAGIGVLAEKPELLGRVLIIVGLAEGIAIYGLIVAIMLMGKM